MKHNGQAGSVGRPVTRRKWDGPGVRIDLGPDRSVQLTLSNLAGRRLLLALGMGNRSHGPEVQTICDGLGTLLIGVAAGPEPNTPHGPGHDCSSCRVLRPLHPGSICCNACFWLAPEQYVEFPTVCPHRMGDDHVI